MVEFILYVKDQASSANYYSHVLGLEPVLNVPGMTEFLLEENVKLGLMPDEGIARILKDKTPHPGDGTGIPRCELYLKVNHPQAYIDRAVQKGGVLVSELESRNWGDKVGYVMDSDGHILAFVEKM